MTYVDKRKYKHQNQRKYIKLPLNTITLLSLSTKGTNNKKVLTYSPFLLQIAKGNINHQRVEEVETHFYTRQNQLSRKPP